MEQRIPSSTGYSRRAFLRGSVLTVSALAMDASAAPKGGKKRKVAQQANSAAAKLSLAAIGCGGMGNGDIQQIMDAGMSVGALCDVDDNNLRKKAAEIRKRFPDVRLYQDFREMLEKEKDRIHTVSISTPDHSHAPAAALAISLGKHVYCQKPLTHTVWEAHRLSELARSSSVVTQMGNQSSANNDLRRAVEVLQSGVIGSVREVHLWTDRPIWPEGLQRPERTDPVPPTLNWDLWLSVAPERPFVADTYHPFKWRGWYDFGNGAMGDMVCHLCNLPFRALNLGYANEVEAQTEGGTPESFPKQARVRFQFPARPNPIKAGETLPPLTLMWYQGGWRPDADRLRDVVEFTTSGRNPSARGTVAGMPDSGCYLVGEKGGFFSSDQWGLANFLRLNGESALRSINNHDAAIAVPETLPRSGNHYHEWVDACVANKPGVPYSRFEIAAYLTEITLVGCFAYRMPGRKIEWDSPNMRSPNTPEIAPLVKGTHRPGWTM